MGDVTHVASETIQGYRVVRSFGGEVYEEKRFLEASQSNTDKQLRMTTTGADLHADAATGDLHRHGRADVPGAVPARRCVGR